MQVLDSLTSAELDVCNPLAEEGWDDRVRDFEQTSFFHGQAWAKVLRLAYKHEPLYLTRRRANTLAGFLPLMEVRSALTGTRGVSLPFSDDCPVASDDSSTSQLLAKAALDLGRDRHWKYCEFRGPPQESVGDAVPSLSFCRHTLDLRQGEAAIWKGLDRQMRQSIHKAQHEGVEVSVSTSLDAVRRFYTMHCATRQKHGLPPQPRSFFDLIHRHILETGQGFVVVAAHRGLQVASAVCLHLGGKAIYKYSASNFKLQQLRATNLVGWEVIRACLRRGLISLDFGRTSMANEGLRRYKRSYGTLESPLHYYRYDFRRSDFVTCRDDVIGWHNSVFHRLPVTVNRWLGAFLYRHIS